MLSAYEPNKKSNVELPESQKAVIENEITWKEHFYKTTNNNMEKLKKAPRDHTRKPTRIYSKPNQ